MLLGAAIFAATAVATLQPSVTIKNGTVLGVDLPQFGQDLFLGIPYAQPPVGDLRLRLPRSMHVPLSSRPLPLLICLVDISNASFVQLDATAYGPHCWSRFTTGFDDNSGFNNSEDCLTLNVIRPHGVSEKSPVPVVVWIHGGGFFTGGSADFRYNGTYLVQSSVDNGKPIVFVSINYRLASLGFMGGKALLDEGVLNLGLRDQRLALHWLQENIAKFGGNPNDDSWREAGGISVHAQIIAYKGRDDKLFNQAIVQSGSSGNFSLADTASFQATYNALITNTSCSSTANASEAVQLSCIRSLPIDQFRHASASGATGIVFDGDFIDTLSILQSYKTGNWVKVAFVLGSNTDEGRSFAPSGANTTDQVKAMLTSIPVQYLDAILELYPNVLALGCPFNTGDFQLNPNQNGGFMTPGLQNKRVAAITGDVMEAAQWSTMACASRVVPGSILEIQPWSVSFGVEDYVGHFTEVGYVFNTQNNDTDFWIANHFTATYLGQSAPIEDRFLGVYMSQSWASFVATGDPNNANVTTKINWPKYSEGHQNLVWQTQGSTTEKDNYREAGIKFVIDNIFF
ncbi:Alpha/Beta hydrolase protein [Mycena sp. CBHHK59/15]|nr:Alpha/Beta hydrolase protein [Mycena sp. CBHHK59/15]